MEEMFIENLVRALEKNYNKTGSTYAKIDPITRLLVGPEGTQYSNTESNRRALSRWEIIKEMKEPYSNIFHFEPKVKSASEENSSIAAKTRSGIEEMLNVKIANALIYLQSVYVHQSLKELGEPVGIELVTAENEDYTVFSLDDDTFKITSHGSGYTYNKNCDPILREGLKSAPHLTDCDKYYELKDDEVVIYVCREGNYNTVKRKCVPKSHVTGGCIDKKIYNCHLER